MQSETNLTKVKEKLNIFIETHSNLKHVNFIYSDIERMTNQFYFDKNVELSIEEISNHVDNLN